LLDRLLDADPGAAEMPSPTAAEALHFAVRRDLEALLNARRRRRPLPALLSELTSSVANYGIPDPASGAYTVPEMRVALAREVEATIRRFEPRLTKVSVSMVGPDDDVGGTLRLKVDAVLRADPVPESISFETLLEPVTRDVTVREA
jgi:type VI secretion system protein ImpF